MSSVTSTNIPPSQTKLQTAVKVPYWSFLVYLDSTTALVSFLWCLVTHCLQALFCCLFFFFRFFPESFSVCVKSSSSCQKKIQVGTYICQIFIARIHGSVFVKLFWGSFFPRYIEVHSRSYLGPSSRRARIDSRMRFDVFRERKKNRQIENPKQA